MLKWIVFSYFIVTSIIGSLGIILMSIFFMASDYNRVLFIEVVEIILLQFTNLI